MSMSISSVQSRNLQCCGSGSKPIGQSQKTKSLGFAMNPDQLEYALKVVSEDTAQLDKTGTITYILKRITDPDKFFNGRTDNLANQIRQATQEFAHHISTVAKANNGNFENTNPKAIINKYLAIPDATAAWHAAQIMLADAAIATSKSTNVFYPKEALKNVQDAIKDYR